jgi:hypothetical protein
MPEDIYAKAVELLLSSMSQSGDGLMSSFLFGKPGAPLWTRNLGVNLKYDRKKLIQASLYVRQNGPAYLKYLTIDDVWSMLQNFVTDNYWYLSNDVLHKKISGTYAENVSAEAKSALALAMASSRIFKPIEEVALFPLTPIRVSDDFQAEQFFLCKPTSITEPLIEMGLPASDLAVSRFPPLADWKGRQEIPSAWLGIRSPAIRASNKMKVAILSAVALTQLPTYRYMVSGRHNFGGYCNIRAGAIQTTFGPAHTPPLMHDIIIGKHDHLWLGALAKMFVDGTRGTRKQIGALEYFYRAWFLEPSDRFAILCMTLDAIFGDASHATQSVIDGVRETLGSHVGETRLRQLMQLRNSVVHGGAPDLYDSRKYARYFDDYDADPIHDLELVVAGCLRLKIFGDSLKEHADPNAAIVAQAQAKGLLPKNMSRSTILEAKP